MNRIVELIIKYTPRFIRRAIFRFLNKPRVRNFIIRYLPTAVQRFIFRYIAQVEPTRQLRTHLNLTNLPTDDAVLLLQNIASSLVMPLIKKQDKNLRQLDWIFNSRMLSELIAGDRDANTGLPSLKEQYYSALSSDRLDYWQHSMILELEQRLGLYAHGYDIPKDLWLQLGVRAWRSSTFIEHHMKSIEMFLCDKVFYQGGEIPAMRFHPYTLWVLLAGYPLSRGARFYSNANLPQRNLQEIANALVTESTDWASFSDLWLIQRAYRQWVNNNNWSLKVKSQLKILPTISGEKTKKLDHPWVKYNLNETQPIWLETLQIFDELAP